MSLVFYKLKINGIEFDIMRFEIHMRTWNLPALVRYLTPLKGLYFSPYISRRLTLRPDTAI